MSTVVQQLQTLRRQAGVRAAAADSAAVDASAATPTATTTTATATATTYDALRRRLQLGPLPRTTMAYDESRLPGEAIAAGVRLIEHRYPHFPPTLLAFDRHPAWVASERLLCVDTETTGLSGGTGTRAFMIGAADWCSGELRVRQLLLTRLSGEAAMLAEFASWLHPQALLVSYNGKCYDLPLLRTRWRLARQADASAGLAHVDLLHAVRRRYRGVWENCRLGTVERELLRVVRDDDLPGSEAPAAFTRWLRLGASTDLIRVLEHNAQDLLSLALLAIRLGEQRSMALDPPW